MQRIGVVGAGRFGTVLALSLAERGAEVIVLEEDRGKVQSIADFVTRAVQGDASQASALAEAGFKDCDTVVVALGSNMEGSILSTIHLKELNVPTVVARAESDIHGKVLDRVGADQIVNPNKERAQRLARALIAPSVFDYFEISEGVGVIEIKAPSRLVGKSLAEARIRNVYGGTVLSLRRGGDGEGEQHNIVAPTAEDVIEEGDKLVIFGPEKELRRLEE